MHSRSRGTTPTADDVMLIARKAGLAEFLQYPSKAKVDIVRADAWLATGGFDRKKCQNDPGRPARQGWSTRRFFGQERLISATLGCVQQSNTDVGVARSANID